VVAGSGTWLKCLVTLFIVVVVFIIVW